MPTPAQLRHRVGQALADLEGTVDTWQYLAPAIRLHLGPWIGMTLLERWESMGALELELLADALEERAAIRAADGVRSGR